MKKAIIVSYILSIFSNRITSQSLDSFAVILKKQLPDTIRIKTLNAFAWELRNINPDTSIILSNQAKKISAQIKWKTGIAQSHHQLGVFESRKGNYNQALLDYQNALILWDELISSSNYLKVGSLGKLRTLGNIGMIYKNLGDFPTSIRFSKSALLLAQRLNKKNEIAKNLSNIGIVYTELANYPAAIDYYLKSLRINQENDLKPGILTDLCNLSNVYAMQADHQKALDYNLRALHLAEALNDEYRIEIILGNIGLNYLDQKEFEIAIGYFEKALKRAEILGDKIGISRHLINMGLASIECNENLKAIDFFQKSLEIDKVIGNKKGIASNYGAIGHAQTNIGKYSEAEKNLTKAVALGKELKSLESIAEFEKYLTELYEKINRPNLAYEHYKKHITARDSIKNDETLKKQTRLESNFEWQKKQNEERLIHEKEKSLSEAEAKKQKDQRNYFIIGFSIVLVLLVFIFRSLKLTQKQKNVIEIKERDANQQKHTIEEKQKEILDSINYAKRIQYSLLAHDEFLKENLPIHFVYYNPKDIVSGDFYWATKQEDRFYLAVCDSTGHGVPGAFMSLLNIGFLSEAINEKKIEQPHKVFDFVRERLTDTMSKEGQKDGFDGILLCFDRKRNEITYAAANNAPVLIQNGVLKELEADHMPVGAGERKDEFSRNVINASKGDVLFLFTDGYADQFGGPKGKKFKYKQLNELLLSISQKSLDEQKVLLKSRLIEWQGELEQVDDICIIGIKL